MRGYFQLLRISNLCFIKYPKSRCISYVQGQSPEHNSREYFYFIDHHGMLFLDDSRMKNFTSCFKEKKFLNFFFKRLKINSTGKYEKDFPFISPCGREKNFVRCDDLPIVFTHILEFNEGEYLSFGYAGEEHRVKFEPEKICMFPDSGRVYHPGPEATGGVGLIKSSLAIDLSNKFIYKNKDNPDEMPIYFMWKEKKYPLTNEVVERLKVLKNI